MALNRFCADGLADYREHPTWHTDRKARGGEALMAYFSTPATQHRGVGVESYIQRGTLAPPPASVAAYLAGSGIRAVCVGHKPVGDSPMVVRCGPELLMVHADISYSDPERHAVSEVCLTGCLPGFTACPFSIRVHGFLAEGSVIDFALPEDRYVGFTTRDGYTVKAKLKRAPTTDKRAISLYRVAKANPDTRQVDYDTRPLALGSCVVDTA